VTTNQHLVPSSPVKTTVSLDATAKPASGAPTWALALLWSAEQPHRVGEVAFLPAFEVSDLGRGDDKLEKFVHFVQHRPGEPLAPKTREGLLSGEAVSRRQLQLHATAVGVEMDVTGRCPTFVNGEAKTSAILKEGDTVLLRRQALLLCVRRPRALDGPRASHPFGEPDKYGLLGEAPATWALRALLLELAASDYHVLIQAESGAGKEVAAAYIHRASRRASASFVSRNAATIPVSVADLELGGNVANYPNKGDPARPGLFGAAEGGTLFFDEVGDCHPEVQSRLLRVLDEGEFPRLGDPGRRRADFRFIGATNRDDSYLRPDLLERFERVVRIRPLRERREDIPLLVRHWLLRRAREDKALERFLYTGPTNELDARVSPHLLDHLVRQPLPRNVRQLNNFLAEAGGASPGSELVLPSELAAPRTTPPVAQEKSEVAQRRARRGPNDPDPSREELVAALRAEGHNLRRAGERLGALHRNTVRRLVEKYGISKDETVP
jgi:DNA-binding NtrC family response regulator